MREAAGHRKLRVGEFARLFWREVSRRMEPSPLLMVIEVNPELKREYKPENRTYLLSLLTPSLPEEEVEEGREAEEAEVVEEESGSEIREGEPEAGEAEEAEESEAQGDEGEGESEEEETEGGEPVEAERPVRGDPRVELLKKLAEEFDLELIGEPLVVRGEEVDLVRAEISPDSFGNLLNPRMRPLILPMPAFRIWLDELERLSGRVG